MYIYIYIYKIEKIYNKDTLNQIIRFLTTEPKIMCDSFDSSK